VYLVERGHRGPGLEGRLAHFRGVGFHVSETQTARIRCSSGCICFPRVPSGRYRR
jgi:hypothetical protein